jgi:hypothetical protein
MTVLSCLLKMKNQFHIISVLCGLVIVLLFFNYFPKSNSKINNPLSVKKCNRNEDFPTYFELKTKLGVNYDAGHWFHMAENFMVYHSVLRQKHLLSNSSEVYLNFDKGFNHQNKNY